MNDSDQKRSLLVALKATSGCCPPILSIPVGSPVEAVLRPVSCSKERLNINDIKFLTDWRNRYVKSFLTEFEATESRTEKWLAEVVGPDDTRILFMVDDLAYNTIGYMGLAFINWETGYVEGDAIVRGLSGVPGCMTKALHTMLMWAKNQLNLKDIWVRVRSDNSALSFYQKAGFLEAKRVPLRKINERGIKKWIEDKSEFHSELYLVYMEYNSANKKHQVK
jgi:hypothetical protein